MSVYLGFHWDMIENLPLNLMVNVWLQIPCEQQIKTQKQTSRHCKGTQKKVLHTQLKQSIGVVSKCFTLLHSSAFV